MTNGKLFKFFQEKKKYSTDLAAGSLQRTTTVTPSLTWKGQERKKTRAEKSNWKYDTAP